MISNEELIDEVGDNHFSGNSETPLRKDAFDLSDDEKIQRIKENVEDILLTLGMDLTDDSLKGNPNRVAKMFVKEIFVDINPKIKPPSTNFENKYKSNEQFVEKYITVYST